jgi:hypothetical protein
MKESKIDILLQKYPVQIDITEEISLSCQDKVGVYGVEKQDLDEKYSRVFILDCEEARSIACFPHIVGEMFSDLNKICASKFVHPILELTRSERKGAELVQFHLLRAAPGYKISPAFKESGLLFKEAWIRPRYKKTSFRDHLESRKIEVYFKDFSSLPKRGKIFVVAPDTIASGNSMITALKELHINCEMLETEISGLILYGYISLEGLEKTLELTSRLGIQVFAFALEGLSPLASNRYDMPLYGPDVSYWESAGKIKYIGGITTTKILEKYIQSYTPGCDQPGDFSARQKTLFNGFNWEDGDIETHLLNSRKIIEKILQIGQMDQKERKNAREEIKNIDLALKMVPEKEEV